MCFEFYACAKKSYTLERTILLTVCLSSSTSESVASRKLSLRSIETKRYSRRNVMLRYTLHAIELPVPLLSFLCHCSQEEEGSPRNSRALPTRPTTGRGYGEGMQAGNLRGHDGAASILIS